MPTDEPQVPTRFPPFITAGTTFKVNRSFRAYGNTDWSYSLILAGAYTLTAAGTPDPTNASLFNLVIASTDTAKLNPSGGKSLPYSYVERLTALDSSGEIVDVTSGGKIMVEPDLGSLQPGDSLEFAEKMLAAVRAELYSRLTGQASIENYAIAGRSVTKIKTAELEQMEGHWMARCQRLRNPGKFSTPIDVAFPTTQIGPTPFPWWRRGAG